MDENDFLGLAQKKIYAIIEAFLPSDGRESWKHIYIKTSVKSGNDGRNGIAEDDTHYCIRQTCRFEPIEGHKLTAVWRPVTVSVSSGIIGRNVKPVNLPV